MTFVRVRVDGLRTTFSRVQYYWATRNRVEQLRATAGNDDVSNATKIILE